MKSYIQKLSLNENYIFKDKATNALNDLQLFLNTNAFTYTEKGYKLTLNTFRGCNGQDLSYQLIENKNFMYVFTELKNSDVTRILKERKIKMSDFKIKIDLEDDVLGRM